MRSPARDRTARRQACHRLSSGGFPLASPPLPVASGTRVRARRPPRTASSHRPGKVAGFPGGGRLPPSEQASAQNRVFWAVQVSWEQVNSRDWTVPLDRETPISDRARNSRLTGPPAQCAVSAFRSGGRVFPRARRREGYFPTLGTTTPDRESCE